MDINYVEIIEESFLKIKYEDNTKVNSDLIPTKGTITKQLPFHDDFRKAAKKLLIHVARVAGLLMIDMYKPEESLTKKEQDYLDKLIKQMNVLNVTRTHNNESGESIEIVATKVVLDKKSMKFKTPPIDLSGEAYGYEAELTKDINKFFAEAKLYAEKNKSPQLTLALEAVA